jgi:hypothetical protein
VSSEVRAYEEQWLRCSGTKRIEDTEVIVDRRGTEESIVWTRCRGSGGRKTVK